ncbi:MAG: malonyl-CoA synthase [Pseudomonadota bacterium]
MTNPLFDALFASNADRLTPFLISSAGDTISYREFVESAARMARLLVDHGLKPGDRLALQVRKSPQALMVYAACVQTGVVFLPLNTDYPPADVAYFLADSSASMIVCDPARAEEISAIAARTGARTETLAADGSGSLTQMARTLPVLTRAEPRQDDDLVALLYTSGTTGRSKGAMLSQRNLLSNARTLEAFWAFSGDDVLLHALPIFHTHGLFVATNTALLSGSAMIFLSKFDVEKVIQSLPHATTMMGVPTFYTRLLAEKRFTRDLVQNMRLFVSGSAPLLPETHRAFKDRTGHDILERYGMTETNMNTSNPYKGDRRAGTVGHALPGVELKITDPRTGSHLPQGQIGQIEVRGPNVFQGYWKMPEKTAAELRDNGFFVTGDLGKIDEDGYVHIVGRDKDLIISGGYNIYPKEIELLLDAQNGVLESAVIGVPHADFGETVVALVVAEASVRPNLDEIASVLRGTLARFKHPQKILLVDELPRNAMGKVQKNVLRERYRDILTAAGDTV